MGPRLPGTRQYIKHVIPICGIPIYGYAYPYVKHVTCFYMRSHQITHLAQQAEMAQQMTWPNNTELAQQYMVYPYMDMHTHMSNML